MSTLKAQVREASAKGKQLRREGVIPAVLFGKHLDESISIQIPKGDVEVFLRTNPIGSKLDLVIGKKKYMALFKNITFTPIINAPEVAILGVSRSSMQPVWNGSEFVPRLMCPLSLSYDHRVIDGAAAARFNAYLANILNDYRRVVL